MKKTEKLGSKLFEEYKMDEVSSLASVVGGAIYTRTNAHGCTDWLKWNSNPSSDAMSSLQDDVYHQDEQPSMALSGVQAMTTWLPHMDENHFEQAEHLPITWDAMVQSYI